MTLARIVSPLPPLKPRQLAAVPLVASGMPDSAVAKAVGVRRETIVRWKRRPAFCSAVQQQLWVNWCNTERTLQGATLSAAETLRELLHSNDPKTRLAAAKALLATYSVLTRPR